jgi:hypothetical protein
MNANPQQLPTAQVAIVPQRCTSPVPTLRSLTPPGAPLRYNKARRIEEVYEMPSLDSRVRELSNLLNQMAITPNGQ